MGWEIDVVQGYHMAYVVGYRISDRVGDILDTRSKTRVHDISWSWLDLVNVYSQVLAVFDFEFTAC